MKDSILIILLTILLNAAYAQPIEPGHLRFKDSLYLANLPPLPVPEKYLGEKAPVLPPQVDNSKLSYFPPIIMQAAYSCEQSAAIRYAYTYEMCRARNLPASQPENRFPQHYTWNFLNGGDSEQGVSYFHSFDLIRRNGHPNEADWGEPLTHSFRWMSGYEKYLAGMHNKLDQVYNIDVSDEQGLQVLKHFLHDHLDGGETGGVLNFQSGDQNYKIIPDSLPEGGKHIVDEFGWWAGHAMTIVGYNDSVRYDVNGDGIFTNDQDITGDGVTDLRDWEIGALKFANSFGGTWADSGFCYMLYRTLALPSSYGGAWHNSVQYIKTEIDYEPALTMKLGLTHIRRNRVNVLAGISLDTSAYLPDKVIQLPILSNQGGDLPMKGSDTAEMAGFLEAGFDISPLLSEIEPGAIARLVVEVHEEGGPEEGSGILNYFSIYDLAGEDDVEIICDKTNEPMTEDGITRWHINHTFDFNKVEITTQALPPLSSDDTISVNLSAEGGTPPYTWSLDQHYHASAETATFPQNPGGSVPWLPVTKTLDFDFPFFDTVYTSVTINANGLISFEDFPYQLPYLVDDRFYFNNYPVIAPGMSKDLEIVEENNDGVWLFQDDQQFLVFWQVSEIRSEDTVSHSFACDISPDGKIRFYYSDINGDNYKLLSGISSGDGTNRLVPNLSFFNNDEDVAVEYDRHYFPPGTSLSKDGELKIPPSGDEVVSISCRVTDNNNISSSRHFKTSSGITMTLNSLPQNYLVPGDTASMNLTVNNIGTDDLSTISILFNCQDPKITLINEELTIQNLNQNEEMVVENALSLVADETLEKTEVIAISLKAHSAENLWVEKAFIATGYSELSKETHQLAETKNNRPDPGDEVQLKTGIVNYGNISASNTTIELSTTDDNVDIVGPDHFDAGSVAPGHLAEAVFNLAISPYTPEGYTSYLVLQVSAENDPGFTDTISFTIGRKSVLVIDLDSYHYSAPAMDSVLGDLGLSFDVVEFIPYNLDVYKSIFLNLGIQYSGYELIEQDGIKLTDYLNGGGRLYMEGRTTYSDDLQTAVHEMFNIEAATVNYYEYDTITGIQGSWTEGFKFDLDQAQPVNNVSLNPQNNAVPLFSVYDEMTNENVVVAVANSDQNFRTIASTFEFGNLVPLDSNSSQKELMKKYLDFFDVQWLGQEQYEQSGFQTVEAGCFPNPARESVEFTFALPDECDVTLQVYDFTGCLTKTLISGQRFISGSHKVRWDFGRSDKSLRSGLYVFRLTAGSKVATGKVIINH